MSQHEWTGDDNERAIPAVPAPRRPQSYNPLHQPDMQPFPGTVAQEIDAAHRYIDQVSVANIHDHTAMVKAAVGLDYRIRALLAALDTERGEQR